MRSLEQLLVEAVQRVVLAVVLQELAEVAVVVVAHRLVERQRLAGHLAGCSGCLRATGRPPSAVSSTRRLAAVVLHQLAGHGAHAGHGVDHVDRHADRAAVVGDGPGDRLANPPGGVGRELVAAGALELVDRPHQAGVAFLDQVEEAQAAIAIALGDGDHQPQVAGREIALGGIVRTACKSAVRSTRRSSVAGLSSVIRIR